MKRNEHYSFVGMSQWMVVLLMDLSFMISRSYSRDDSPLHQSGSSQSTAAT
jgi:hypothetical protein